MNITMSKVETLDVSRCDMTSIHSFITRMTILKTLILNHNKISDISPLVALGGLEELYIESNDISDFGIVCKTLSRLFNLNVLGMKYVKIYCRNNAINLFESETGDLESVNIKNSREDADAVFVKQICYKSAVIHSSKNLEILDGAVISGSERKQATRRMEKIGTYMKNMRYGRGRDAFDGWTPKSFPLGDVTMEDVVGVESM